MPVVIRSNREIVRAARTIRAAFFVLLLAIGPCAATADDGAIPLALQGYDVVAYFTDGKALSGVPEHHSKWDERRYRFATLAHKNAFVQDPEHFLPQFAGFCATGISLGVKVVADPELWKIVDDKLYVFASAQARDMVDKDPELLRRAQREWDSLDR